jgi:hypothetical protein
MLVARPRRIELRGAHGTQLSVRIFISIAYWAMLSKDRIGKTLDQATPTRTHSTTSCAAQDCWSNSQSECDRKQLASYQSQELTCTTPPMNSYFAHRTESICTTDYHSRPLLCQLQAALQDASWQQTAIHASRFHASHTKVALCFKRGQGWPHAQTWHPRRGLLISITCHKYRRCEELRAKRIAHHPGSL